MQCLACDTPARVRGLCDKHYRQVKRRGQHRRGAAVAVEMLRRYAPEKLKKELV